MILTKIEKRRNKIVLSFDSYEKFEIYYDVYLTSVLFKGDDIPTKRIEELKQKNAEYEVKNSAFRYLSNRNHSSFELKNKLKKKGFATSVIDTVISELLEKKYLNDYTFADNFVRHRIERRKEGVMKITSELYKKGIPRNIIAEVTETIKEHPQNIENATELGTKKLEKIKNRGETDYNKIKSKLFLFLKGRGFTSDVIFDVINELISKNKEEL